MVREAQEKLRIKRAGIAVNDEQKQVASALETWWTDKTEADIAAVVPKAVEYSAIDLIEYGRTLALVMGIKHPVSDEEATEIGIWGYLVGKVARWTGAIKEGRRVSDDTIHDIKIYATMAERTRDVGGWPFGPKEDQPITGMVVGPTDDGKVTLR